MFKNVFLWMALLVLFTSTNALAKKDCSHTKTMDELKKCDPAQYEETQRILNNAQAALNDSYRVQAEANQALDEHANKLHQINQDLEKILQDAKIAKLFYC